jgi:hypothetical protein
MRSTWPSQSRGVVLGTGQQGIQIGAPLSQRGLQHQQFVGPLAGGFLRPHHAVQPAPAQNRHQRHDGNGHQQLDQGEAPHPASAT